MGSARYVGELSRAALAARDGMAVVIRIFMDESGTHDGSPVVSVGAYCGKPRAWERWTRAWNVAKSPIKVFHSTDCQNLAGEFHGWSKDDRDALVIRALATLRESGLIGLGMGINLNDLNEAFKGRDDLKEMFGTPYGACFHWLISEVISLTEEANSNQSLAFFHEQNDFQGEALRSFNFLRDVRKKHHAPMTLSFAPKSAYVPLQAADVLAYEANKVGRNVHGPRRASLKALGPHVHIRGFSKENMPWLVSRLSVVSEEVKTFGRVVTFFPDEPRSDS